MVEIALIIAAIAFAIYLFTMTGLMFFCAYLLYREHQKENKL